MPAPRLRLAAFARVHVAAGATTTVRLAVGAAARAVMSAKGAAATGDAIYHAIYTEAADEQVIEPGRLVIHVGGGQPGFGAATLAQHDRGHRGRRAPRRLRRARYFISRFGGYIT